MNRHIVMLVAAFLLMLTGTVAVSQPAYAQQDCLPGMLIPGNGGPNVLNGTPRNDEIRGGGGNDLIRGFECHDRLYGGAGDDEIRGGKGDDYIDGGPGYDVCIGGPGNDVFVNCEVVIQ
jgi:Ca2+-binding RTX toxin-like protein